MGNSVLLLSLIIFVISIGSPAIADDYDPSIQGCIHFCEAQFPQKEGQRNIGYDNCIVQTQAAGKCGSGSSGSKAATPATPKNVPIPTARPDNTPSACKTEFDRLQNACSSTTQETVATCDESSNQVLQDAKNSANNADTSSGSVQKSCEQTKKISGEAKTAMTTYRDNCTAALTSCRSACAELALFLSDNKCWADLSFNMQTSKQTADAAMDSCNASQAKVDDANRSIANYSSTNSESEQCQAQSQGLPQMAQGGGAQEQKAEEAKTYCQINPTAPGCGNAGAANCGDPSQANNKVCVCSANPSDPMCGGGSGGSAEFSSNIDSSSRVPSNSSDFSPEMPSSPDVPVGQVNPSGDPQGIDGRQNTASLDGGGGGSGLNPAGAGGGGGNGSVTPAAVSAGSYGGGGGGSGGMFGGGGSYGGGSGGAGGGSQAGAAGSAQSNPDLRQFLPGGIQDPSRMQGKAGSEAQGITGPHSSNWRKIQNRYQILKGTLEP